MGYKLFSDGNCKVCGKHTEEFCDHCLLYVCEDHENMVEVENAMFPYKLCPDCYKKFLQGKAKIMKFRYGKSPVQTAL